MFIYFLLYKLVGFSFFLMPNEFTLGFIVFTITYMPTVHSAKCCSYELCKSAGEASSLLFLMQSSKYLVSEIIKKISVSGLKLHCYFPQSSP